MICRSCGKDLPLEKFSVVTSFYLTKDRTEKTYFSVRKSCNRCVWGDNYSRGKIRKKKRVDNSVELLTTNCG